MKNLRELTIKPEKVIKNEELVNLRGGVATNPCGGAFTCYCIATYNDYNGTHYVEGYICNQSSNDECMNVMAGLHPAASSTGCSIFGYN